MKKSLLVTLLILLSLASPCFADTFQLNLKNGLNYISIPIGNAWNIKDILDQIPATTKQVAYWSTDNSRYFMYANDPVFDQFSTFEYGKGYWIYLKDASNMSLTLNGSQPVGYSLNLKKGWNAIGCIRTRETPIEEALLPLKMGVDYSSVWRYSGAAYPYQQYSAKTKEFTTLKPGEGYWIYMIKDAVLISPPAKPTINSPVSPTANNSQAITGTRVSNTLTIVVTCPGSTVGTVSYPSSTTWSCTLSNLTHGANDIVCQAKNSGGYLSDPATASITYNHPPQLGSVTPSSGASNPGEINSFITSYIDTDAWQDIKSAQVIFGTSLADPKMLLAYYDPAANKIFLRDDANTAWLGGFAPGSGNTIENSYAKLDCSRTSVIKESSNLTVNWGIIFKNAFIGSKKIYCLSEDNFGANSTWIEKGSWVVIQTLSIQINPKLWSIGAASVNNVVTMPRTEKITVTNNGNGPEAFELSLVDPSGWNAAAEAGTNKYVLSGIFCNTTDNPLAGDFNNGAIDEDAIFVAPKRATSSVFAYAQSTANAENVLSGVSRALFLQFKSPKITAKRDEQAISVIISCQTP